MKRNKEYHETVKKIVEGAKAAGLKLSDTEMAKRLNISRAHFNVLKGSKNGPAPDKVSVTDKHLKDLRNEFAEELKGKIGSRPSVPGDLLNRERAQIKVLMHHVAKLESKIYEISLEKSLVELEQDTTIAQNDLERK